MNIILLKFLNLTEKLHLIFYQVALVFALFFYVVLKGATGHRFVITNEEIFYSVILFLAFVTSGLFKENKKFGKKTNRIILYLFLFFSVTTLLMSLYYLYFTFTFDYGFKEEVFFILICFFLIPILFTWCNLYIIKKVLKEIKK